MAYCCVLGKDAFKLSSKWIQWIHFFSLLFHFVQKITMILQFDSHKFAGKILVKLACLEI